jgi:hypothetical protein
MENKTWEDKIFNMVKAASPKTAILGRKRGVLHKLLMERGEIPFRRTWEAAGMDLFGHPYYIPKDHPLQTEWLTKKKALKGADTMLIMDIVKVDDQKLRQMRREKRGGCDNIISQINQQKTKAEEHFLPLVTSAGKALAKEFGRHLKVALPFWQSEIKQQLSEEPVTTEKQRCLNAYADMLKKYEPCINAACSLAPALYVEKGGIIGMDMTTALTIPGQCPANGGRNYVEELKQLGSKTTSRVLPAISDTWSPDLLKMKALSLLKNTMDEICTPAHRRFSTAQLQKGHKLVSDFIKEISELNNKSQWKSATGQEKITGHGGIEILAKTSDATNPLTTMAASLKNELNNMGKCRDSRRRPIQISLINVGTSEVYFSAIDFEEQFICENLAPGIP